MEFFNVIIVGTGHGGAQAAVALRQQGFEGAISLAGRDRNLLSVAQACHVYAIGD